MKKIYAFVIWATLSTLTAGFVNAHLEHQLDFEGEKQCSAYREDLAFSVGSSMIPPFWIVAPFVTGFYEHGWRLMPRADCVAEANDAR